MSKSLSLWLLVLLVSATTLAPRAHAQRVVEVNAVEVERAIKSAIDYLLIQQRRQTGSWEGYPGSGNGQTALVTLSLLTAGLDPNHRAVRSALTYLRGTTPTKTYDVSLQIMVFCAANPNKDFDRIDRLAKLLEAGQLQDNGWTYDLGLGGRADLSNSQFAALALWEAQRVGVQVKMDTLKRITAYWKKWQNRNGENDPGMGGWAYNNGGVSGSMTSAGVASMIMAEDAESSADVEVVDDEIVCCGADYKISVAEFGLRWLARNFSSTTNPGHGRDYLMYYLYGVERVGRLTGQRMLGRHDWYREGCEMILFNSDALKGNANIGTMGSVTETALALLFLSKGKRQIVISRAMLPEDRIPQLEFQYSFRRHSHAVNHLNGHIELAWKRDLSWQSVQLDKASVTDLLESPVLFMSGSKELKLSKETEAVLKAYVEQGGFIFAEASHGNGCDGSAFDKSFRDLMARLFETPLRKLDPSHAVWNAQTTVDVDKLPPDFWLYGIESCCRTAVIYSPISLACRWEIKKAFGPEAQVSKKIEDELNAAVGVGVNVVTYATGRQLKDRLEVPKVELDKSQTVSIDRGTLRIPRLRHAGGDDDTPQAVSRLLTALEESMPTQVDTTSPLVTPTSPDLKKVDIVYISGRNAFQYSQADRDAMREYFNNGGFLLGDAVCASKPFADALKQELSKILPDAKWESVAATDDILTNDHGGFDIRNVTMMDPGNQGGPVSLTKREGPPVLERLVYKQRTVCLFSPYDISCALESRGTTQCLGYVREDAARIGINMIQYAREE